MHKGKKEANVKTHYEFGKWSNVKLCVLTTKQEQRLTIELGCVELCFLT